MQQRKRKRFDRYNTRPSGVTARGYACVALENPADGINVGHTLRAAMCFQARLVVISGAPPGLSVRHLATDPGRSWRHIPVLEVADTFESLPLDCTPVAVELTDDAVDLVDFVHPERACYIFGRENGSLSAETLSRCVHVVRIPTSLPLNLAAAVNVLLYDRLAKTRRHGGTTGANASRQDTAPEPAE